MLRHPARLKDPAVRPLVTATTSGRGDPAPNTSRRTGRSDAGETQQHDQQRRSRRPPSPTASPIIRASEAKAVNQVSAISASQPLAPTSAPKRGAEMPEIVIGNPGATRRPAKKRIARRQAKPDHIVDDRHLRVVEHRLGEHHAAAAEFRPDAERRQDRDEQRRGAIGPAGKICGSQPGRAPTLGGHGRSAATPPITAAPQRSETVSRPNPVHGQDRQRQRA